MALFSKKHYWALRDALRASVHSKNFADEPQPEDIINHIANMLARDNPAFERQRFITEIYVPEATVPRHRSQES